MKRLKTKIFGSALAVLGMLGLAKTAYMAPTTTPTEVLDTVVGSGIDTVVSLVTVVITDYFPYILVFGIIVALFVWIKRFATVGTK
jgi:hypothetical protein